MRWIVGDVHGCARELERLLREIRLDPAEDELWSLGDLVNRGPDSAAAVRLWRDAGGRAVVGNHDVHALRAARGEREQKAGDTLDGLLAAPDAEELLGRLAALPALVHLPPAGDGVPDVWLVHAGLHPAWRDLHEVARRIEAGHASPGWHASPEVAFATRARCCTADGAMSEFTGPPAECPHPYRPWDEYYAGAALVVHGHWAARGHYRGPRTMGLDSGCVYGGRLTAWCQEERRIVAVPAMVRRPR